MYAIRSYYVNLTGGGQARPRERAKVNTEAYDYLLRARSLIMQFTPEANAEARAMLEHALAIDPTMATAYAGLAMALGTEYTNGWNNAGPERPAHVLELARRGYAADENDPVVCNALALSLMCVITSYSIHYTKLYEAARSCSGSSDQRASPLESRRRRRR